MSNYLEVDFRDIESKQSGDAITMRYSIDGVTYIHTVDGGFKSTGSSICHHIREYYNDPEFLNHVVVTHSDQDHAGGVQVIIDEFDVGTLWMLRPWNYADELIDRFQRFSNVENLRKRLRELYPAIATIEEIAIKKGINIEEPFQGKQIGAFTVVSPSKERFLDLILESDKTPEAVKEDEATLKGFLSNAFTEAVATFKAALWGEEKFSPNETSAENEMSVVQYCDFEGIKFLLTGDTGRAGLTEAADYLENIGVPLPGIDRFQVPHHGSRRNVSSETLDRLLGQKLTNSFESSENKFRAYISAAKEDKHHPRKSVIRAMIHRGANVFTTEGSSFRTGVNSPERIGWTSTIQPEPYPSENEE